MTGVETLPASVWLHTADPSHVFAFLQARRDMAATATTERARSRATARRTRRTHEGRKSS